MMSSITQRVEKPLSDGAPFRVPSSSKNFRVHQEHLTLVLW